jgi:hypothetical protein
MCPRVDLPTAVTIGIAVAVTWGLLASVELLLGKHASYYVGGVLLATTCLLFWWGKRQ